MAEFSAALCRFYGSVRRHDHRRERQRIVKLEGSTTPVSSRCRCGTLAAKHGRFCGQTTKGCYRERRWFMARAAGESRSGKLRRICLSNWNSAPAMAMPRAVRRTGSSSMAVRPLTVTMGRAPAPPASAATTESASAGVDVTIPAGWRDLEARSIRGERLATARVRIQAGRQHLFAPGSPGYCFWLESTTYGRRVGATRIEPLEGHGRFWTLPQGVDTWFVPNPPAASADAVSTGGVLTALRQGHAEVRRDHRLAGTTLGREHGDDVADLAVVVEHRLVPRARAVETVTLVAPLREVDFPSPRHGTGIGRPDRGHAHHLFEQVVAVAEAPVRISELANDAASLYRVRLGPLSDVSEADRLVERLARLGIRDSRVILE